MYGLEKEKETRPEQNQCNNVRNEAKNMAKTDRTVRLEAEALRAPKSHQLIGEKLSCSIL